MNGHLLLDTHITVRLDSGDQRLLPATRDLVDQAWQNGGTILFSAVSAWEIALLVESDRIALDLPAEAWVSRFVSRPGVNAVPLTCAAACGAYQLHHLEHRDPGDRLLIATAIELGCPLVTYDQRIAAFAERYGSRYRFTRGA